MYKKESGNIVEYEIIPASERVIRVIRLEEFDKEIADLVKSVNTHDLVKFGTLSLEKKQAKLAELQMAKTEMEKP